MSDNRVDTLITTIDNLPPLPAISASVMAALNRDEVSIIEVTELIETDIALATQILKVANSPAYGAINTISTIQHAIMMLGLAEVHSLLLVFAVQKFFNQEAEDVELRRRFWTHSQICSYTAVLLNRHFKFGDTSAFFLAGLIHDIGKLVVDQYLHDEYQKIITEIKTNRTSYTEAEKSILGVTHYHIGAKLLQHWRFPKQLTMQIFLHHAPWKDSHFTSGSFIIFLANILTKLAGHPCLEEEKQLTIEEFCQSKAFHLLNKNGFEINRILLDNFLIQIKEFASLDPIGDDRP